MRHQVAEAPADVFLARLGIRIVGFGVIWQKRDFRVGRVLYQVKHKVEIGFGRGAQAVSRVTAREVKHPDLVVADRRKVNQHTKLLWQAVPYWLSPRG